MPLLQYDQFQRVFPNFTVYVNAALSEGVTGILGRFGSGKTTLARAAVGLQYASGGGVRLNGIAPSARSKAFTAYLPEHSFFRPRSTVGRELRFFEAFPDFSPERARAFLEVFRLGEKEKIASLTPQQQRFLGLSLVLARRAEIYLLDEPPLASGLAREVFEDFLAHEGRGKAVVLFSADAYSPAPYLERALILKGGRVAYDGTTDELNAQDRSLADVFEEVTR